VHTRRIEKTTRIASRCNIRQIPKMHYIQSVGVEEPSVRYNIEATGNAWVEQCDDYSSNIFPFQNPSTTFVSMHPPLACSLDQEKHVTQISDCTSFFAFPHTRLYGVHSPHCNARKDACHVCMSGGRGRRVVRIDRVDRNGRSSDTTDTADSRLRHGCIQMDDCATHA